MKDNLKTFCSSAEPATGCGGGCGGTCQAVIKDGVLTNNPIILQVIGICSCIAVTNRVLTTLVMGGAIIFITAFSNLLISVLRNAIPHRVRFMTQVAIIATFVIFFDQLLRAFYWDMAKQLEPYIGLIITNCVIMGRAEKFAMHNKPLISFVDGIANGLGFALFLLAVALFREPIGSGTLLGFTVLSPSWYENNLIFVLAPGAFFTAGFIIWFINALTPAKSKEETGK